MEASEAANRSSDHSVGSRTPRYFWRNRDPVMIHQRLPTLAMQKVEGSSPFSRSLKAPQKRGFLLLPLAA
jgi:hypothetical protein